LPGEGTVGGESVPGTPGPPGPPGPQVRTHSCGCEQSLVHKHFNVIEDKCTILLSLININQGDRI
jgi:hypothetical protein